MTRVSLQTLILTIAAVLTAASCGKQSSTPPVSPASQPPAEEVFGAASLDEFKARFKELVAAQDPKAYRSLHYWKSLPVQMKTALSTNPKLTIPVCEYTNLQIDVEPMSEQDLEQAKASRWTVQPTHWLIARGEGNAFSTWELAEHDGRFYFANRLSR